MSGHRSTIEIETSGGPFSAYVSAPERVNGVAVVVLQEIFGVNANMRATADGFAAQGCAAVVPDLYWRQERGVDLDPASETGRERAMELMKGLDRDEAVSDAAAALEALREQVPGIVRSAAVGYCFGGGVAYLMAARGAVDAGVSYYGTGLQGMLGELEGLERRLLLHIAADDHLCPPDAQEAIVEAARRTGGRADVHVHPGVGHAFARAGGATYNQAAADKANAMTGEVLRALAASDQRAN